MHSNRKTIIVITALFLLMIAVGMSRTVQWRADARPCGNGKLDPKEQCDDNNNRDGDGCSMDCVLERGWACRGMPNACHQIRCGDDMLDKGELCDDGNMSALDGCSAECKPEKEWACVGEPSRCHPILCGDGFVDAGEACDDRNGEMGDGCDGFCRIEKGWMCSGVPSVCKKAAAFGVSSAGTAKPVGRALPSALLGELQPLRPAALNGTKQSSSMKFTSSKRSSVRGTSSSRLPVRK